MLFKNIPYLAFAITLLLGIISVSNAEPGEEGCCSLDYKQCIGWCGPTKDSCLDCNHHDGVAWLENGAQKQCKKRWVGCGGNPNKCCAGLECRPDPNTWLACLPALSTPELTPAPTPAPTAPKEGCCSLDYKNCIGWCGKGKDRCESCNHHDGVVWLENGKAKQCKKRWVGCQNNPDKCCPGLECRPDPNNWLACLPAL